MRKQATRLLAALFAVLALPATATQTINGITIDENLPQARRGVAYSYSIPVSGGTAPYTFALIGSSNLPIRITLAADGSLSGVVSCNVANGSNKQDIRVTDSSSTPIVADFTGNKGLSINVTAGPAGTCVTLTIAPATLPTPTVGNAYSQTITASGGLGPYTYSISAGTLPAGLALNTSTGQISGTPTSSGAYSFTVSAIDAADSTGSRAYSGTVNPAITVNPATLPGGTVGTAYSQTVSASGGNGTLTLSLSAGSLPAGLSFNAATGVISGTPTTAATSNFTITGTDGNGATGSRSYAVTINPPVTVNPASLPVGTVGNAYSQSVTGAGGNGSYTFSVTAGTLPAGLSLNASNGAITGTPSSAGSASFTITATDGNGAAGSRAYSVTVNPAIAVSPATLPAGTVGTAYSQTVSATGGNGSFTFSVSAGSLPAGLSLNSSSGAITGTPSSAGGASFTITATDGNGATGSRVYSVTVNAAVAVNPASLPNGTVGVAYSQSVNATGGNGSYTFSVSAGALPAGLSLNASSGAITGTPSAAASSSFTITATDGNGATGSRAYSVTIFAAITVNPASLPTGTVGVAYSQSVSATGGNGSYTFSVSAGALPAGLSLNASSGAITGTPSAAATSSFTITATDGNGATGSRAYSVTINAAVAVNPATLPAGTVGTAYSQSVSATGGNGSYTFTVTAGTLPVGFTLNASTGAITGTPSSAGPSSFTITATDGNGATGARPYSVTINAAIAVNPASLPNGTVGVAYSQSVSATGGNGSYTFSVSAGALPAGLSLNASSGAITGTPSSAATNSFTITAADGNGATGSRAYTVIINAAVAVNPASLPNGAVGVAYSQSVSATGGNGSYTFSVSAGALPAGLSLNGSSGAITGTPSSAGSGSFTITATDGIGATGSRAYSVTINAAIAVNPASLPGGTVGVAYSQSVSATGGNGSYTFSVSAGALPAGLSLNGSSGAITGTPSSAGSNSFTVTATDGLGATGSRAYSMTINAAISVTPATLVDGTIGMAYSQTVGASGGTGSFTFGISAGALPAGLSLNAATGAITGTPTSAGSSSFTVTATDGNGATGSRGYSVTINAAITVNPASLPTGTVGVAYSQSVSATGGNGSYSFSVSAGSLPAGLSLNASTGAITGAPSSAATSSFTITATDGLGATASRAYSVTINAAVAVNPATLPAGTVGIAYNQAVSATGGNGAYTFSVSAGALPTGLSLNASSGAITGTPSSAGSNSFTITATDGNGATGSRAYTVTINAAITVNPATLPAGTVGAAYSQSVSATGGNGSYTFSVSAGALPAGLSLNTSSGAITGAPSSAGSSSFTVTATDGLGATGSRAYTVTINAAITISPASLPNGTVGVAYSQSVSATGGNGSYTYSVSAGALPAGLSLNASSGAITGTPSSAATSSLTITATDGNGVTGSRAYSVTINGAIAVNPASLPGGTVGTAYSQSVSATGGTGSYTFALTAGALPSGLSLDGSTGAITGTPSSATTSSFTITATDGNGGTGSRAYNVTINAAIGVNPASLPTGTVGVAYSQSVSATGGNGSYTYSVSAGALPAGLSLNASSGAITGTPSSAGSSSFTITATDGNGVTGSRAYSVTINAAITVNPASLPGGTVGVAYSQLVSATGGNGSYTFSVSAGALPAGLSLNASSGAITGTPSSAGSSSFTITATDGNGVTGSRAYSATFNSAITVNPATLPNGTVGVAYSQSVSATGGNGSYTFTVSAGALPAGLSLNGSSGAIAGTPSSAASSSFTITATDGNGVTGSRAYSVTINSAITVNPASLPAGTVGVAYTQSVSATGGNGSYTFSVSAGALPTGLSLNNSSGAITGTPSSAGSASFTITATDGNGATGSRAYSVTINAGVNVNPASLPNGTVGLAYSQTVSATGGNGSYTFTVSAGALPAGLSLNASSGAITGTPSSAASSSFTITATDGFGATGSRPYSVTINAAITVNPASLPNGTVGGAYSQSVSATGGTGSFTFSVSAGALPAGLTLNAASGSIGGTPSSAGSSSFTVTATDGNGATGSRAYSVTINAAIALNPPSLPNGTVGVAYSQSVTATGGTGSYTFSVSAGALPAGLTLNAASGAITGTPSSAATSNFTVTATDGNGATGSRAYGVTINAAIAVNPASLTAATAGTPYSQSVSATGGTGTFTYSVSVGALPAGLTLNATTGAITGTPSATGVSNFTVTATDGNGATGVRSYVFTVNAAIVVNPATIPAGTVGAAYSRTFNATGGNGTYSYSVTAGTLPTGVALNASSGALAGTPTTAASYAFTITATDGLGATGARAYTVAINAAISVAPNALPGAAVGSSYSQPVIASGGSGTYTYSVSTGSLPAGLALNTATGMLWGMPTAAGPSTFAITATDSNGVTGVRTFTLAVNAAIAVNPATLVGATAGSSYSQTVTAIGGSGTFTFAISAGTLPAGLTLDTSTGAITGTPTTAGNANFTVTATDGTGATASRAYNLAIAAALTLQSTTLGNGVVGTPYSQTITVNGGTAPYTFAIIGGQLPAGVTLNAATGALSGTPQAAGSYSFTIRVVDANGAAGTFAQTIVVEPRADPTQNATVRGIASAQVAAANRFGEAQIQNIGSRLRMLHLGHDPCSVQFDVGANIQWEKADAPSDAASREAESDKPKKESDERKGCDRLFAFWAAGTVDFGFLRPSSATDRSDFKTSGLTLGADARVVDGLVLGAAVGYGRDQSEVGSVGSNSSAQATSATFYGSYEPLKSLYVDFALGYGNLGFESSRLQNNAALLASRNGSQMFGSVGLSGVLQFGALKLAPYGRFDRVRSRFDGYVESGSRIDALSYGEANASENALAAGLFASYSIPLGRVALEPSLRLEQRWLNGSSFDQPLAYADAPAAPYLLVYDGSSDSQTLGGIGLLIRVGTALSFGLEYTYTGSGGTSRTESVRAIVRAPF